jgi:hypothetical protein
MHIVCKWIWYSWDHVYLYVWMCQVEKAWSYFHNILHDFETGRHLEYLGIRNINL